MFNTIQIKYHYLTQEDIEFELSEAAISLMKFMGISYDDALYYCNRVLSEDARGFAPKNVIDARIVEIFRNRNNNKAVLHRVLKGQSQIFRNGK